MLTTLLSILVVAFVLWVVYFIAGKFIQGTGLAIIGLILGIFWVVYALNRLGLVSQLR